LSSNEYTPYVKLIWKHHSFFSQCGCLENKISQIRSRSKWGTMNKYVGSYILLFVHFFKIHLSIFFCHPMVQWMYLLYITNLETSLIFCSRWLPRK